MKKIAILDTSVMSFNIGDQIIMDGSRTALANTLKDAFVVNFPTHSPLFHRYEFSLKGKDSFSSALNSLDLKIVCGTNLLEKNMFKRKNTWNIHLGDTKYINDIVLMGVGTDGLPKVANWYTKLLYRRALSSKYIHSTRDEKTKEFVESLGLRAINTGCPTLWSLTEEHCKNITSVKQDKVIFTVTDYKPDYDKDAKMIKTLQNNYAEVSCWLQGVEDLSYIKSLPLKEEEMNRINFIAPSLNEYDKFLTKNNCDYVGTRLHAGIRAMQKGRRSIIIGVDNRAKDMNDDVNLNYLDRSNLLELDEYIKSEFKTEVKINQESINAYLGQFK